MPEIPFNIFREAQINAEIERRVARARWETKRKVVIEPPAVVPKPKPLQNWPKVTNDGRVRTLERCPYCLRMAKAIDGKIISHRKYQLANGYGTGQWCENSSCK